MRLLDANGEKLGRKYLTLAEELLPQLDKNSLKDHTLHAELKYIIIKIRLLILQQDDNALKVIKKLYKSSKNLNKNCDNNTINCFTANMYLEMVYLAALSRFGETEMKNRILAKLQEMFDKYPQHNQNSFVKHRLVIFYHQIIEIPIAQNDVIQTDIYASKMLENEPNTVMKAVALQYQAVVRLNTSQTYFKTEQIQFIEDMIASAKREWSELQQNEPSAAKHHRFFTFLIHMNYNLFSKTEDAQMKEKYGTELISIFEENCLKSVLGSLEFANLDIAATYLEVCLKMQKYEKILLFCANFLKGKSKFTIPFDFEELLNVARLTAELGLLNAANERDYVLIRNNINMLKIAMNALAESASGRKVVWYDKSLKLQYDFYKELGLPEEYQKMRLASSFYLPSLYDKCSLIDTWSNASSITSICEVIEVKFDTVKFLYLEINLSPGSSHLQSVSNRLKESYERLQDLLVVRFQVEEHAFIGCNAENMNLEFNLRANQPENNLDPQSYVIVVRQVAGKFSFLFSSIELFLQSSYISKIIDITFKEKAFAERS